MPEVRRILPGRLVQELAAILKEECESIPLKQSELAALSDTSQATVSKYLRGVQVPDIDRLDRICNALGLDLAEVVGRASAAAADRLV